MTVSNSPLPGEALRDQFLPVKSIPAEIRRRLAKHQFQTVSPKLVEELEAEGWVVERKLKKSVKMRKEKPHDVAFEDRVWSAFAKLQFTHMNAGRQFKLAYGQGANETQQVDVFAADDEVVLVVECKSANEVRSHQFKKEIESISGQRAGLIRLLRSEFKDHKIKFILATNNYTLSKATLERIEGADVVHMDEDTIDYYLGLADHLGKAARFQLLGSLFAHTKIPGLEPRVAAIKGRMGGHTYYSFAIEPARLLKMAYVLHRNRANSSLMPTYQRLIKKSRLKGVSQFVSGGGFFPNSIILNIETDRKLQFDLAGRNDGEAKLGILHLPQTYRAAYVIDGQHRLYGYAGSPRADSDLIPVVAFVDLPRHEQVRLFMQINENQQAVPKNLRNTLNADLLWESPDLNEQARALKLRIAQHLGEVKTSPMLGRVIIGENQRTAMRCITIDAISNGLNKGNFIGSFSKTAVKDVGTFYAGTNDATYDALVPYLEQCFGYLRDHLNSQWALGSAEGGFIFINSGVESLLRVLSDIVDHLVATGASDPRRVPPADVFDDCKHYLDPLIDHLSSLTVDEGAEYRRMYGSGGGARYWRRLQAAIRDARPEFNPPGLDDYVANEAKAFNTESFEIIRDIETFLNRDIEERLEDEYGSSWLRLGVPRNVGLGAATLAAQKNLDLDPEDHVRAWDCLHLIDYYGVLTQNHDLWKKRFEKRYTRPGDEQKPGGWKGRASWLQELNRIRNENSHTYSVSEEEYEFLVALKSWLLLGQAENDL